MVAPAPSTPEGRGVAGAIIVAAGAGTRLPGPTPKPFLPLAGRWVVERVLDAFDRCPEIRRLALVVADAHLEAARARLGSRVHVLVPGGRERRDSVAAGLHALEGTEHVVVHDGARPFVSPDLIARVLTAAREVGAATAALPVTDTVKEVDGARVRRTLDRSGLVAVQTPQAFETALLRRAHGQVDSGHVTDDAELVERLGAAVAVVPGDPGNVKITTPDDLAAAQTQAAARWGKRADAVTRVGIGYDVHRLVPGRTLVLAGVHIQHPRGLEGYSDADVVAHAVIDALLGAAGERDIGHHFPPDEPAWRNADSMILLASVGERLAAAGWQVENIDAVILAEEPRVAPHVDAMRRHLADALGVDAGRVGVKATTAEGLGAIGRAEGIACQAVALLRGSG